MLFKLRKGFIEQFVRGIFGFNGQIDLQGRYSDNIYNNLDLIVEDAWNK